MKKFNYAFLIGFVLVLSSPLQSAENQKAEKATVNTQSSKTVQQNEYDILKRNQIDDTDTLAIPFDDSEVEDEEEIDQLEKKNEFQLPQPPKK